MPAGHGPAGCSGVPLPFATFCRLEAFSEVSLGTGMRGEAGKGQDGEDVVPGYPP